MCLSYDQYCVGDFSFLTMTKVSGLQNGTDGILGLGPESLSGSSYLDELYKAGMINEKIFGIYLTNSAG